MVKFERDVSHERTSCPYKAFLDYLTDINKNYWSLVPALSKEKYLAKQKLDNAEVNSMLSADFFHATGEHVRRIPQELEEWVRSIRMFENWNRINILISIISNFETYLSSVIRVAMEANPSLLFNYIYLSPEDFLSPADSLSFEDFEKIDGVIFLKKGLFDKKGYKDLIDDIESKLTHGDWTNRTNTFYKLFPNAPAVFRNKIKELEDARKLRNNAAHSFGREISQARENRNFNKLSNYDSLSEERLIKYFKLFSDLSTEIDNYLLLNHIGSYEIVYYYHKNYVENNGLFEYDGETMIKLKRHLTSEQGTTTWGKEYLKGMIKYYHGVE